MGRREIRKMLLACFAHDSVKKEGHNGKGWIRG